MISRKQIFNLIFSGFLVFTLSTPQASAHSSTKKQDQLLRSISATYAALGAAWYSGDPDAGEIISTYYTPDAIFYSPFGAHQNSLGEIAAGFQGLIDAGYDLELEPGAFPLEAGQSSICVVPEIREQAIDILKPKVGIYGEEVKYVAFELGCYRLSGEGLTEYKGTYSILWLGIKMEDGHHRQKLKWFLHRDILNHVD